MDSGAAIAIAIGIGFMLAVLIRYALTKAIIDD
jgi:hypothetical protein